MDRRTFLAILAASLAAPAIPAIAQPVVRRAAPLARFDASKRYGNSISVDGRLSEEFAAKVRGILMLDARRTLPTGTPFALIDGGPRDYGLRQVFAWYYEPGIEHATAEGWLWERGTEIIAMGVA